MEALAPFVPLCEKLGRLAQGLGDGFDRVSRSSSAGPHRVSRPPRLLGIAVFVCNPLRPHQDRQPVNAPQCGGARERAGRDQGGGDPRLHRADHGAASARARTRVEVAGNRRRTAQRAFHGPVLGETVPALPPSPRRLRYADRRERIGAGPDDVRRGGRHTITPPRSREPVGARGDGADHRRACAGRDIARSSSSTASRRSFAREICTRVGSTHEAVVLTGTVDLRAPGTERPDPPVRSRRGQDRGQRRGDTSPQTRAAVRPLF